MSPSAATEKKQGQDKRPYKQVLDDLWAAHQAPREPDAPTFVSLFAGAGGSSLGYSAAGFRELLAVEWDAHACRCLRQNFPGLAVYEGDVSKLTAERALELAGVAPGELDVLDGSPPCQGFSTAGKREMSDSRNQLFREYVRMLGVFRPRALVMENVSGMVKGKMKLIFAEILRALRGAGYVVGAWLLNAMHYGVPQSRERMIFVGVRSDLVGAAPGVPSGDKGVVSVREACGIEALVMGGHGWMGEREISGDHPSPTLCNTGMTSYQYEVFRGVDLERWRSIPPGGNFENLPEALRKGKGRFSNCFRKVHPDRPGYTIGKDEHRTSGRHLHWSEPRHLSDWEVRRIGSFPDQYGFPEGTSGKEVTARVGNSVPPLLMTRIASHVREAILFKLTPAT